MRTFSVGLLILSFVGCSKAPPASVPDGDTGEDAASPGPGDAGETSNDGSATPDAAPVGTPDGPGAAEAGAPAHAESPSCTTVTKPGPSITDATGHVWTLASSATDGLVVHDDGALAGYSAQVTQLAYVNHVVWQENSAAGWWSWNNGGWTGGSDPTTSCGGKSNDAGGGSGGGPTAPPQAVAAGFTTPIVDARFKSTSEVSTTLDGTALAPLYTWNNFGAQYAVGAGGFAIDTASDLLTITQATAFGAGIATACSATPALSTPTKHATNTGFGIAFNQGYIEATLSFDYQDNTNHTLWMNSLRNGSSILEIDIMESFTGYIQSHLINWQVPGMSNAYYIPYTVSGSPLNTTPGAYNRYGFLWTSSHLQFFINDAAVTPQIPTNTPISWNNGDTGAAYGDYAFNNFDAIQTNADGSQTHLGPIGSQFMYLQFGTWSSAELVKQITVWQ